MLTTHMKSCGLYHPPSPPTERDIGAASDEARCIQNLLLDHRRLLIYFALVRDDLFYNRVAILIEFFRDSYLVRNRIWSEPRLDPHFT